MLLHSRATVVTWASVVGMSSSSVRPSVDITFSETVKWIDTPILVAGTYPPHLQTILVFQNFNFFDFFYELFSFLLTWNHMGFQTTSILKVHIGFTPHKSCIPQEGSLPKLLKELWNLKFWICLPKIFFVFVNMIPYGGKLQTTSPLKEHTRFAPQNSCILLGRVSTKVVKRIVTFEILNILTVKCSSFPDLVYPISQKWLIVEQNGPKFGPQG